MAAESPKKQTARAAYKDFVVGHFGRELGQLSDKQRSTGLIRFYVDRIHNRLRNYLSEEDIEDSLVDGTNDLEADLIHRDDGVVTILQAKYFKDGNGPEVTDVEHFQTVFKRLLDPRFKKNTRLADKLAEVDFANDAFVLRFIALGRLTSPQAIAQTSQDIAVPAGYEGLLDRTRAEYLDEGGITEELRSALSFSSGIPGRHELVAAGGRGRRSQIIVVDGGEYPSYVLVVHASQLVQMYQQAKDSLFTINIRNFIGNTQTNKSIIKTARQDPVHFFHYNNGIACLARKVDLSEKGDRLITEGIQVINGAQTVKSLFRASQPKPPQDDPLVLVRVTEVSKGYGDQGRFTSDVTRYNNTQNVIKASDFKSNDPIQTDLRDKFAKHMRFGRSVDYAPKRTDFRKTNATAIRLEEFAKVIYSFLRDPIQFSGSTSFLFDDGEKGGYRHVFGDGKQVWTTMPDEEFKLRSAVWWMSDAFAPAIRTDRANAADANEKAALERKWFIFFASRLVLERSFGAEEYRAQLIPRWRGEWKLDEGNVGVWFRQLYDRAKQSVVFVYKQAAKQKTFVHRNWMRSADTVSSLTEFIMEGPFNAIEPISATRESSS